MWRLAFGELLQGCHVTVNECFLLGATPSLEPSFTLDGIRDAIEPFRKHQFDWTAGRRVSGKRSVVVLGNSCLKRRPRRADIQGAIATPNNVEVSSFRHSRQPILRDAQSALLRMRGSRDLSSPPDSTRQAEASSRRRRRSTGNTDLRSLRSKRLEGWPQQRDSRPSFETRPRGRSSG
jgi:hypothetical protein